MLVKKRRKPTYLLTQNPQIKLWYICLGYASNARVIKASKFINGIDITVKDNQQRLEEYFSFNSEKDNEVNNSELSFDSINTLFTSITILLNKITSIIN